MNPTNDLQGQLYVLRLGPGSRAADAGWREAADGRRGPRPLGLLAGIAQAAVIAEARAAVAAAPGRWRAGWPLDRTAGFPIDFADVRERPVRGRVGITALKRTRLRSASGCAPGRGDDPGPAR